MVGPETLLMLGEDHVAYGTFTCEVLGRGLAAGAISRGGPPETAGASPKRDPNEDALVVLDDGRACLLAVADAHWGRTASHELLGRLARRLEPGIPNVPALVQALEGLAIPPVEAGDPSETTLLVVAYDRRQRRGFGVSYGDSTCVFLEPHEAARVYTEKTSRYVSAVLPGSLTGSGAQRFRFLARPGGLLVLFTDGVDECHYARPETSVGPRHLETLFAEIGADPPTYARRLAKLALAGVDGHPGGEDNLAIVAVRT